MLSQEEVLSALENVVDPCAAATGVNLSVVQMGMVKSVQLDDGAVTVSLRLTTPVCMLAPYFIHEIEENVRTISGVRSVTCIVDKGTDWEPELMTPEATHRLEENRERMVELFTSRRTHARQA